VTIYLHVAPSSGRHSSSKYTLLAQEFGSLAPRVEESKVLRTGMMRTFFSSVEFSLVYNRFLYSFRSVTSGPWRPFPLACAVGHTSAFAVNAALVAS